MDKYRHKSAPGLENFWVIVPISNPARFRSRYELFQKFKAAMDKAGVNLLVVEAALGNRPFEVTQPGNPNHVQLRTHDELWHKENMVNVGISRLPANWEYVAWIDGDVEFMRQDWAEEAVHQLQHYQVIQMFQSAIDLGPEGEYMTHYDGFAYSFVTHADPPYTTRGQDGYTTHWHPGFAWAARREAIDALGGLIDFAILGAADHHMAWALIGAVLENSPQEVTDAYKRHLSVWQHRANTHIRQNIGYMPGTLFHHFHGRKSDRRYIERWSILFQHNYDPDHDLKKDWQGLHAFSHAGARMRNDIREYFRQRNEDTVEL